MFYDSAIGTVRQQMTEYTLHGKNIVYWSSGTNTMHFFYDARNKPAVMTFNGTAYACLYNLQGDVIALIDSNGKKVVEYKYDAWGRILSKTGTMASTLGTLNPFRYRGYVYDEETGPYYLRSRYYNPEWARFLNADTRAGKISHLIAHNLFCYCLNTPIASIDATGYATKSAFSCGSSTVAVSAGINAAIQIFSTTRVVGKQLKAKGVNYAIAQPLDTPQIGPVPKVIAKGFGSATSMSAAQLGINFTLHDFENVGPVYVAVNALITTNVNISIIQTGDLPPEAHISLTITRGDEDSSQGYHHQITVSSGEWYILNNTDNRYLLRNLQGDEISVIDEEGWINLALENVTWE